ncbi:hypothetical protein BWP19_10420 [Stenotrophomonas maltophilia]|nr:hypothetical protein BMR86_03510 [Stenotrophomonas sp. KAs 5-3]OOD14740.1 hypothetical protein BWP19_10420 [Stenotrophomonas maltophilia]
MLHSHSASLKPAKRQGILSHSERHQALGVACFVALGLLLDQNRLGRAKLVRLLFFLLRFFFALRFVIWVLLYRRWVFQVLPIR